jgi:putative NADH-flavin reductase
MQIGVIGATGTIGSRIVSEAQSRGHHVTAFSRDASQIQGRSRVSVEDAAVAVIDEVELPRFVQRRFTVGY